MSDYWLNILILAGINAILAWSLGLVVRSGQLSVGHAALAGVGGYTAGWLTLHGWGTGAAVVGAMVVAGVVGAALCALTLRLNHLFLALATLVFGEVLVILATDSTQLGGAAGLAGLPLLVIWPFVFAVLAVVILVELFAVRGSRFEVAMLVLAGDATLVDMSGRSSAWLRVKIFALSSVVAGLGGALLAFQNGVVQPSDLAFANSLNLLVFAVVGGSTSGIGALFGGFGLTVLPKLVELDSIQQQLLLGAVLVVVMLLRKDGLVPRRSVPLFPRRRTHDPGDPGSSGMAVAAPHQVAAPQSAT